MGVLIGCAMVPMAVAMLVVIVAVLVQEPFALVWLVGLWWLCRAVWRAHRRALQRREAGF